jgi:zinc protease
VAVGLALIALASAASGTAAVPLATRESLANGLVLLVAERAAIPVVAIRAYVRGGGAAFDPPDRQGLANLVGALLTRGSAHRTAPEIDAAIEFVGGRLEVSVDRDGLVAAVDVLAKDFSLGLSLLSEVLTMPTFLESELARKRAEIDAAIQRSEESPDTVASRVLQRLVFAPHPYARPVEGTRESLARLQRTDVVGFHGRHVRPDATVIAVAGAIGADTVRGEVLARLGAWSKPASAASTSIGMASPVGPPRLETVKRELAQATIVMGRQAIRQTDPDYFALAVAAYVLGGGSSSRLYGRIREEAGLAYSVWSDLEPGRFGAAVTVGAQSRTAAVPKVIDLMREELARMVREPVGDRELELAKSYLIGSFPFRLDTTAKLAGFIASVEALELGADYPERYRREVAKVTAADVLRVSKRFLHPDSFSRAIVGQIP